MTSETILVVDAGQDVDQKMAAALEAEGYLVYPVSSQDVNAEMAELLRPSLIFLRPPDLSPTGLKSCKAIHAIPLLKKVPIIILASVKKPPGPDTSRDYGIVDFLELTFSPEELIEKTGTILGKTVLPLSSKEDEPVASPRTARRVREKRSPFLLPAIGIVGLLVIAGAGFLAYQQFMTTRKASPSSSATGILQVPSAAPKAGSKIQLPPGKTAVEAPVPPSSIPSGPPGVGSKPQPPPEKTVAATPVPPSSVPSGPPGVGSKPQSLPGKTVAATPVPPSSTPSAPPGTGPKPQVPPGKTVAAPPTPPSSIPSAPAGRSSPLSSGSASHPTRKPFYSVQLGAFKNENMAQALTKRYREKGYDAFTHLGLTKDKTFTSIYRVLVGRYEEIKTARKLAGEMESKEEIKTAIYSE